MIVSGVQEHVAMLDSVNPMSDDRLQREIKYFHDFSAIYSDAIRSSDFKANIALLFLPLLMVPILSAHERSLAHIPLWLILTPFLAAYFLLLLAIFPRYMQSEKSSFHLSRTARADHFVFSHDAKIELDEVRHRVALLARILWWKTLYLRLSLGVCLIAIPVFGFVLAINGV
jgi:hypothetical protein